MKWLSQNMRQPQSMAWSFKYKTIGEYMNNEIIKFVNGDLQLDVTVSPDNETVWLTQKQMALLFDRDEKTICKHINNTFKDQEVEKESNTQKMRVVGVKQLVPFWNKFKWKVVAKYATTTKYGMVI